MEEIKFRQLWKCQNSHDRWAYFTVVTSRLDTELEIEWGERNCDCPTYDLGEGYAPFGDRQLYIGLKDRNDKDIYNGDIVKITHDVMRSPWIGEVTFKLEDGFNGYYLTRGNFSMALNITMLVNLEVVGNRYQNTDLLKSSYARN